MVCFGKLVVSLFGATTPRTAGFNNVDMTHVDVSYRDDDFLLMWIGASPSSTGGGIKTSTFAIATLNIIEHSKRQNLELKFIEGRFQTILFEELLRLFRFRLIVIGGGIMLISPFLILRWAC
jgi:trk system potassium uptake protein TrkH